MIPTLSAMDRPVERPKGPSRKLLVLGGAAGLLVAGLLLALPTIRRALRAERSVTAASLRVAPVTRGVLVRDAQGQGRIVASLHPTLFSTASGIVTLKVRAGEAVRKGQLLAVIDSPELKSRLVQERSTLASLRSAAGRERIAARQAAAKSAQAADVAEVRLAAARRLLERAERTFAEGLLNKTDHEKAKDDLRLAELELANARATAEMQKETADFDVRDRELAAERQEALVAELQRQVDLLSITAPFEGIVASLAVQDRDAVPANAPVLTVVNLSQYEVELSIPEGYGAECAPGTKAEILYEGRELPGKVTMISPEVRDGQVRGTVVFEGDAPRDLRQNQRVSVRVVFEAKPGVLKLPRGPFLEAGGGRIAYVLSEGIAARREVTTGAVSVSEVEVVKGLAEGEKVVISDTAEFGGARTVLVR